MAVLTTPAQFGTLQVATWRAALRMEKVGMKSRGGALRPRIAAQLGLKPRDSYEVFIQRCTDLLESRASEN